MTSESIPATPDLTNNTQSFSPRRTAENLNNDKHTRKPLNFQKAMTDFQIMFPEIDRDVIETVLRANNGVVQPTIDQLLILQESASSEKASMEKYPRLPSYEESSIDTSEEPPPAYADVWNENNDIENTEEPLYDNPSIIRKWKPPLVGKLPNDFLRIDTSQNKKIHSHSINNTPQRKFPSEGGDDFMTDEEFEKFMKDEKLAMLLQNEEFLRELRRNKEFVKSLESDHRKAVNASDQPPVPPSVESIPSGGARPRTTPNQEDAAFKMKLKHMGKSTKKKFGKVAKKFSKSKSSHRQTPMFTSESRFNLLEEDEDEKQSIAGFEGIQESETDVIDDHSQMNFYDDIANVSKQSGASSGRRLPQPPSSKTNDGKNVEPVVFYNDDNEFEMKPES